VKNMEAKNLPNSRTLTNEQVDNIIFGYQFNLVTIQSVYTNQFCVFQSPDQGLVIP